LNEIGDEFELDESIIFEQSLLIVQELYEESEERIKKMKVIFENVKGNGQKA
jgi:hypothetical protein